MSGEQLEKWSHVWGDGSDPQSDVWHPNRLAPILSGRQHDYDFEQNVTLPSLSPDLKIYHPQSTPAAQLCNLQATNSAVTDPQLFFHGLVSAPIYQSSYQQLSPYHGHDNPQQYSQSSNSAADYPLPSLQQAPPTFSNSPDERHASQSLSDSPAPQGNRSKNLAAYQTYEEKFAAVSGVVTPSKCPPGEMTKNPISHSSGRYHLGCLCSVCGADLSMEIQAQCHYNVCAAKNGKSNGASWPNGLHTGTPARSGRWCHESKNTKRDTRLTLPDNQPDVPAYRPLRSWRLKPNLSVARARAMYAKLAAVNGVVIPSKLAGRRVPRIFVHGIKARDSNLFCPLCKCAFGKKYNVKTHFLACVNRNGNPDGLRWDDDLHFPNRS